MGILVLDIIRVIRVVDYVLQYFDWASYGDIC